MFKVNTVPVPSESDISKFLLACTLVNTQLPVFAPKVKDELLPTPLTSNDWPVVTFPPKVAFPELSITTAVPFEPVPKVKTPLAFPKTTSEPLWAT